MMVRYLDGKQNDSITLERRDPEHTQLGYSLNTLVINSLGNSNRYDVTNTSKSSTVTSSKRGLRLGRELELGQTVIQARLHSRY